MNLRGSVSSKWLCHYGAPVSILVLALSIQLFNIGARTLHGDEWSSFSEATHLGQNPNGILYFALMHYWIQLGSSDIWLRIPSTFFVVAAVAVNYVLGTVLCNRRVGIVLSCLLATAPFALVYGQQVRFYSSFLFGASLAYLAFVLFARGRGIRYFLLLVCADMLVVGAHLFGVLVLVSEVLCSLVLTRRFNSRTKLLLVGGATVIFTVLLIFRPAQSFFYSWISQLTNPYGSPTYTFARGLSLSNLAKIPATFFFFGFGESVYPLDWPIVIPGLVLLILSGLAGLQSLVGHSRIGLTLVLSLLLFPPLLYLVFDPLSPPSLQGAAPRYLIFLLPLFYLVIAAGAQRKRMWLAVLLVLLNLVSLGAYWFGDWSYTDDLIDWRVVEREVERYVTSDTLILVDGHSAGMADRYFPTNWARQNTWELWLPENKTKFAGASRLVVLSNEFQRQARINATSLLRNLERDYDQKAGWSQFPLFIYIYDRKQTPSSSYKVDEITHALTLPVDIYGIEFQDVRLPIPLQLRGRAFQSTGAFSVSDSPSMIPLAMPATVSNLLLLTNLTDASSLKLGTIVAQMTIAASDGTSQKFPLRLGIETAPWNGTCQPNVCEPAYSWHKRFALLGTERYPDSWGDFNASIYATEYRLEKPTEITSLEFQKTVSVGSLYVWGIIVDP